MNTIVSGASTDLSRCFTITITMDGVDGASLMRLVSVFHRRQIELLQTTYQRVASTCWMVAIVETTPARVRTTVQTLRNTIGVTGFQVSPGLDDTTFDDPNADNTSEAREALTERVRIPTLQELV